MGVLTEKLGKYGKEIVKTQNFMKMSMNSMILFLQCDDLNIKEEGLWEAVMKWNRYQLNTENGYVLFKNAETISNDNICTEITKTWSI